MPQWFFSLLFLHFSLGADDICYPSVFLHSKNSLPSTVPLCLVVKNDRSISDFSPPPPIQNEDQWTDFVRENNLNVDRPQEAQSLNWLYRVSSSSGELSQWKLPYAFDSEKCHGFTGVEFDVSVTVDCQSMTDFSQSACEGNVLSATALFADEFTLEGMNSSISVNSSLFEIYPPVWRDSHCLNSVIKARLIFTLSRNEEEIESARIDRLIYASLSVSNYSTITPSIEIRYETSTRRKGEVVESGLEEGDLLLNGDGRGIWGFPSGLNCAARSPVVFKQDFVSTCLLSFSSCSDAQNRVNSLLSAIPSSILDSPFADNSTKTITFLSPKAPNSNPIETGCNLAMGASIVITHSLAGPVQQPKRLITSALVSQQFIHFSSIPPNSTAVFIFSLKFVDVTPDPTHIFSSPPHIDLRLPRDFFYPFLVSSNPSLFQSIPLFLIITLFF